MRYVVDVTKPPIAPPDRLLNGGETRESKQRRQAYAVYIKAYRAALEEARENADAEERRESKGFRQPMRSHRDRGRHGRRRSTGGSNMP